MTKQCRKLRNRNSESQNTESRKRTLADDSSTTTTTTVARPSGRFFMFLFSSTYSFAWYLFSIVFCNFTVININMEDLDLSDHKVTSEVHVFSEGESLGDDEHIGKAQVSIHNFLKPKNTLVTSFVNQWSQISSLAYPITTVLVLTII